MSTSEHSSKRVECSAELLAVLEELSSGDLASAQGVLRPASERMRHHLAIGSGAGDPLTSSSSLERHLLATHRHELRQLIEDACLGLLCESERVGPYVLEDQAARPDQAATWRQRVEGVRQALPDPQDLGEPLGVLTRLMNRGQDQLDLLDVALVGMQILPSTKLSLYLALGHLARGELRAGEAVLHDLQSTLTPEADRRRAAANLVHIASLDGDLVQAVKWSSVAAAGHEPVPTACLSWFIHSIQLGDRASALRASTMIPDSLSEYGEPLEGYCRTLAADRLAQKWQPTQEALQFLRQPSFQISNHAARVLNVLR